jgi:hypothetical protein
MVGTDAPPYNPEVARLAPPPPAEEFGLLEPRVPTEAEAGGEETGGAEMVSRDALRPEVPTDALPGELVPEERGLDPEELDPEELDTALREGAGPGVPSFAGGLLTGLLARGCAGSEVEERLGSFLSGELVLLTDAGVAEGGGTDGVFPWFAGERP